MTQHQAPHTSSLLSCYHGRITSLQICLWSLHHAPKNGVDVLQAPFGVLIIAISKGLQQETDAWFANVLKKCTNRKRLGVLLNDLIKFTKTSHTTPFHCETAFLRFLKAWDGKHCFYEICKLITLVFQNSQQIDFQDISVLVLPMTNRLKSGIRRAHLLRAMSTMIHRWMLSKCSVNCHQKNSFSSTNLSRSQILLSICTFGKLLSNALVASHCHIAIHDVALAFYEEVLSRFRRDSLFHDDLKLVDMLPARVVIYLSLVSSDAATLSRMCSLLSNFKTVRSHLIVYCHVLLTVFPSNS